MTRLLMSHFSPSVLLMIIVVIALFVIPCPVNGAYDSNVVPDISSIAVPLKAPLSSSSESDGGSMMERLEKKIQSETNHHEERKMIITAAVPNDDEAVQSNNNEKKPMEAPNNGKDPSTNDAKEDGKAEEIPHRELGAGRALVNAVWFIVIITVIPCLLCTCLLSCLCYMMEWIPSPFSGEYYSSGPYGGGGIWGTGTPTGTGWFGSRSAA